MISAQSVLTLMPVKDATAHLKTDVTNLSRLTFSRACLALGILESDSIDETHTRLEQRLPELRAMLRSVGLVEEGLQLPPYPQYAAVVAECSTYAAQCADTKSQSFAV